MENPEGEEVKSLKLLRWLVTVLTAVMIVGFVILIGFLVTQFPGREDGMVLPESITLPDGSQAVAFTQGSDWYAIVDQSDTILIFDRISGDLRQQIAINPAQ